MGRTQRALTSLVAAIPAGFLAYLLVVVFLKQADTLPTMMKVIVGVALLCAVLVALMPFGLLIFGGARKSDADGSKAGKRKGAEADEDEDEVSAVDDVDDDVEAVDDDSVSAFEDEDEDGDEESVADVMADSDDEITAGPDSSLDEIESVDFEDEDEVEPLDFEDEDEEPAPKKPKKHR